MPQPDALGKNGSFLVYRKLQQHVGPFPDPGGEACPLGAHIRRMNPRDELDSRGDTLVRAHRIVRRGLPYGGWLDGETDDGGPPVFEILKSSNP